jgi:hypothetical protein
MLSVIYAACHIQALYSECHYAECRYAECRGARQIYKSTNLRANITAVKSFTAQAVKICIKTFFSGFKYS